MEIEICISVWFDLIFEVFFGFILLLVDQGFAVYFLLVFCFCLFQFDVLCEIEFY
jgi:hypothetical protein